MSTPTVTPTARPPRVPLTTSVSRKEQLTPHLIRLVLAGGDLVRFAPSEFADSYVKLVFEGPDGRRLRTYTVRGWDGGRHELTLDIVTHGAEGLAGPWAQAVQPGDPVQLLGPGGGYAPDSAASTHLLIGDESALPAIAVVLEALPEHAAAEVYLEIEDPADEQSLSRPVHWVHRDGAAVGERLLAAVRAAGTPVAGTHAFVHGEAGFVKELRAWLRDTGLPREQVSISGYWRLGADDEAWRAVKRDFDRD